MVTSRMSSPTGWRFNQDTSIRSSTDEHPSTRRESPSQNYPEHRPFVRDPSPSHYNHYEPHLHKRQRTASPSDYTSGLADQDTFSLLRPDLPEVSDPQTTATPEPTKSKKANGSSAPVKRVGQACIRCRKQKLRCLGGTPCDRCLKANHPCEYLKAGSAGGSAPRKVKVEQVEEEDTPSKRQESSRGQEKKDDGGERLGTLESSVANLLAGLAGRSPGNAGGYLGVEPFQRFRDSLGESEEQVETQVGPGSYPSTSPTLPSRPFEPPTSSSNPAQAVPDLRLRPSTSPLLSNGPSKLPLVAAAIGLDQSGAKSTSERKYVTRFEANADDPINTGIVDAVTAEVLFNFFIDHCHPFLPIVDVGQNDAFSAIRPSPALFSAMIAIAARFYKRYTLRVPSRRYNIALDEEASTRLANLAETHLASTLLRKQCDASDVSAIVLLAAWGLGPKPQTLDTWVIIGHGERLARSLGINKVIAPEDNSPGEIERYVRQRRTWLGLSVFAESLSLGCDRPRSAKGEKVDEGDFLQTRLNQPSPRPGSASSISLYGDVYIAGQNQLARIAQDLCTWGEKLAQPSKRSLASRHPPLSRNIDASIVDMLKELNEKLDDWFRTWIYAGSPYALYLGPSARIARLHAEHVRLCINSYALKAGADQDAYMAQCLKKALVAAMATIQAHHEASQTDLALSFANDNLTITLGQAAVFLLRLVKAAPAVQSVLATEPSVLLHYLRMAIDSLESADLSETRLSTHLASCIRDISRRAGLSGIAGQAQTAMGTEHDDGPMNGSNVAPATAISPTLSLAHATNGTTSRGAKTLDAGSDKEGHDDLSRLLGLPGDGPSSATRETPRSGEAKDVTRGTSSWMIGGTNVPSGFASRRWWSEASA